jgi:hypothetical protein
MTGGENTGSATDETPRASTTPRRTVTLTFDEAAAAMGMHPRALRRRLARGQFPNAYRDGQGYWRISVSDLDAAGIVLRLPASEPSGPSVPPTPAREIEQLFREEALAELRSRGGPGDVLRVVPRWLVWGFALLLVLVGVGAAAAFTIHVREEAHGTALLGSDGRSVSAILPLGFRGDVQPGTTMRLQFGATRLTARITTVRVRPEGLVAESRLVSPLPDTVPRIGSASARVDSGTLFDLLGG